MKATDMDVPPDRSSSPLLARLRPAMAQDAPPGEDEYHAPPVSLFPVLILAGNAAQANVCKHWIGDTDNQMVYLSGPERLFGIHRAVVIRVGTWYERPDIAAINEATKRSGTKFILTDADDLEGPTT